MGELPPPLGPPPPPHDREVLGLAAQLLWAPIVLVSVPLVVYVPAAFIGIPLFVTSTAPLLAGRQRHSGGRAPRPLVAAGLLAVGAVCAGWVVVLRQNAQSLGDPHGLDWADVLAIAALVAWAAAAAGTAVAMLVRPQLDARRS